MRGEMASGEAGILPRLLADAERHAAEGREREALILLRWASRVAPSESLALVLLTYHRVRSMRGSTARVPRSPDRDPASRGGPVPIFGGVAAEALGFPIPRFPTRAPELDTAAFVPALPTSGSATPPASPELSIARAPRASGRRTGVAMVLAVIAAIVAIRPETARQVSARLAPEHTVEEAAEAALRAGQPARAVAITTTTRAPGPGLLLIRGRALLSLADTAAAAAAFSAAASHPLAGAGTALAAARLLGSLPGHERAAADAYLEAVAAGAPRADWPAAAEALQRAGRPEQARRLLEM